MKKMYECIIIKDNEGGGVKWKNLTPKQAKVQMKEYLDTMEDSI